VKLANRASRLPIFTFTLFAPAVLNGSCSARQVGYRRHKRDVRDVSEDNMTAAGACELRRQRHLRVPVLPHEEAEIKHNAAASGSSIAAYLRNVGMGYQVRGILDHRRVEELARINGDLGRLGGLLKLWLTDDARTRAFGEATIRALLSKIEDTQARMQEVMRTVVLPRADR
jgi:hypothetical protein